MEMCCDEEATCCTEAWGCADCSSADPEAFNPEDCQPLDGGRFLFKAWECEEICHPEDDELCAELCCDEQALCCIDDDCADCSGADPDNFDPDDCVPEGEEFVFKKTKKTKYQECGEICHPEDPELCVEMCCDDDARCCIEGECADCSGADMDAFNPDDCIPEDGELYKKSNRHFGGFSETECAVSIQGCDDTGKNCVTICCDEASRCCVNGSDCADCSEADLDDLDNFDPDVCVPEDLPEGDEGEDDEGEDDAEADDEEGEDLGDEGEEEEE